MPSENFEQPSDVPSANQLARALTDASVAGAGVLLLVDQVLGEAGLNVVDTVAGKSPGTWLGSAAMVAIGVADTFWVTRTQRRTADSG